ncbi:pilin [Streptacidiphilus sp. MAP12-16]|uniref:pilin n=1 Tax=Streptacidiphilus sp. MAP12-16 TaxID=3156300 RepID=UPI0035180B3E
MPRRPPFLFHQLSPLAVRAALATAVLGLDLSVPGTAHAAGGVQVLAVASIDQTISNITNWIVGILAGTATMFLTIGGLRYLMAGGEPGEVEKAKGALKSACTGYMLAILAPVIVGVLKSLVRA